MAKKLLDIKEALLPSKLGINTGLKRYNFLINNYKKIGELYGIKIGSMYIRRIPGDEPFNHIVRPIYWSKRKGNIGSPSHEISGCGSEDELLSEEPIIRAYKDGGIEFFEGFPGTGTPAPDYECGLYIPSINLFLEYTHQIKNKELIKKITI